MKLSGSIGIKTVYGKNGGFNVGMLQVPIGEFVVKNELLDQFDEGQYDVDVVISQIYMGGFNWGTTKRVTELCASIEHIECDSFTANVPESVQELREPEPEETLPEKSETKSVEMQHTEADDEAEDGNTILGTELYALFCERKPLKLDPVSGRSVIRKQSNFLKHNDYRYNGKVRQWSYQQS